MTLFSADSSVVAEVVPSPNHGERKDGKTPNLVVLHYTGMLSAADARVRLCTPSSEVSAHYLVYENGHIVQMVPEARRAWHAGMGLWQGETDINSISIGIEIANPGHDYGYPDYPRRQIAAVTTLCRGIIARLKILPRRVIAHSDIAPARKRDPGEKFPWKVLADSGVGLWVPPAPITESEEFFSLGDKNVAIASMQARLREVGFSVNSADGHYDGETMSVVAAFQRHYRPAKVDGMADLSTRKTLDALIDLLRKEQTK